MAVKELKKESSGLLLEYFVPICESANVDGNFTIKGVAITETTTSNGHTFIAEELSKSASTLINVPLLKDHENRVDNIVGRVTGAHFDEMSKSIPFKAIVKDARMKQMIQDGLINSVSVGAHVNPADIEEGEDGNIISYNITFKELSLVAVPADSAATFAVALNNAYNGFKSHSNEKLNSIIREDKNEMAEEEKTQPQEEAVEAPVEGAQVAEVEAEEVAEEAKEEVTEEKVKAMIAEAIVLAVKEADADEAPVEAESKEEPAEESKEEAVEDEEEEDEEVEESSAYNIVAGHRSFTVERKNYSQRLTA